MTKDLYKQAQTKLKFIYWEQKKNSIKLNKVILAEYKLINYVPDYKDSIIFPVILIDGCLQKVSNYITFFSVEKKYIDYKKNEITIVLDYEHEEEVNCEKSIEKRV